MTVRRFLASIVLLCGLLAPVCAMQFYAIPGFLPTLVQSMKLWGGGFVVGQDAPTTGVHLVRTDSFGGYLLGNDALWHQVLTDRSLATAACDVSTGFTNNGSCFGVYPKTGTSQTFQGSAGGLVEICGSPKDSTRAWMFFNGFVFRSDNVNPANPDAITWLNVNQLGNVTAFTKTADNANASNRFNGHFIGCDPNNKDHVFLGTQLAGLWETKDGVNFSQVSSSDIPTAINSTNYIIAFDPASGVNGSNLTNTVYVMTSGTTGSGAGTYVSTTGGGTGTWSFTAGGPTTMQHAIVAYGSFWAVTGAVNAQGGLSQLSGCPSACAWATILTTTSNLHSITACPSPSTTMVALVNGGSVLVNTASGTGGIWPQYTQTPLGGDAPWQATIKTNVGPTAGDISCDSNGNILFDGGQGIWTSPVPSANFNWTAHVAGVMQPIGQQALVAQSGKVVTGYQDIAICTISPFTLLPPTHCNPLTQVKSLLFANGMAISANDPCFMIAKISNNFGVGNDYSGYSTGCNGFDTNYLPFNSWNVTVDATAGGGKIFGSIGGTSGLIRVTVPSTLGLTTWANGTGSILCSYATISTANLVLNIGPSQTACFAATVVDGQTIELQSSVYTSALLLASGSYVFYVPTPPASSFLGALNITGVANDGTGKIQVSYLTNFPAGILVNNFPICITGVTVTTEANGCWIVSNLNTTNFTFTLGPTSTSSGLTYGGGGAVTTWGEPGGAMAAATDTNLVSAAGNNAEPMCTVDGGKTWNPISYAAMPAPVPLVTTTVIGPTAGNPWTAGATTISVTDASKLPVNTVIQIPMDTGYYFLAVVSANNTVSNPNTISFKFQLAGSTALPIPPGRTIADGANVYLSSHGWDSSVSNNWHGIDSDKVIPNKFYGTNFLVGLFSLTNCNPAVLSNTGNSSSGGGIWAVLSGTGSELKCVPGQAGHCIFTAGTQGAPAAIATTGLWRFCNGMNTSPGGIDLTFRWPGVFAPQHFGLGAPKLGGGGYASIYYAGYYDPTGTNTEANAIWGFWESTDDPNNGNTGTSASCKATSAQFTGTITGTALAVSGVTGAILAGDGVTFSGVLPGTAIVSGSGTNWVVNKSQNAGPVAMTTGGTFHQILDWPSIFPGGPKVMTAVRGMTGDSTVYGPVYINTNAGGFFMTAPAFPYLLKRDLNPAANDNNPVGLGMVG